MLTWIGHFHPLILHLPIGLTTAWCILEFWPKKKDAEPGSRNDAIRLVAIFTALSAVAAAVTGFLLAAGKPDTFTGETVDLHRILGIVYGSACIITAIAWFILHRRGKAAQISYRVLLLITAILLAPTGHLGGNLTHGETYLTKDAPDFIKGLLGEEIETSKSVSMDENSSFFVAIVEPVLINRCYSCHSGSKLEGGVALKPQSELQQYLGADGKLLPTLDLPINHKLHMPPTGKTQLLPDELALLQWYATAALEPDATVAQVTLPENLAHLDDHLEFSEDSLPEIDRDAVRALVEAQVYVHPVSKDSKLLWIDAAAAAPRFKPELLDSLKRLAPNIKWLSLARTGLDDQAIELAAECPNLEQLDLSYCKITDNGLELLADHQNLKRLTLVHTPISDASLPIFDSLPKLAKLSLWKSAITPEAAKAFAEQHEEIEINELIFSESLETAAPPQPAGLPKVTELGKFPFPTLDGWKALTVIDQNRAIKNETEVPVKYRVGNVVFEARKDTGTLTPFLVEFTQKDHFKVLSIGTPRKPKTFKVGQNSLPFSDQGPIEVSVAPGASLAIAWTTIDDPILPFTDNPAVDVWLSGGVAPKDSAKVTMKGVVPGKSAKPYKRTYAFAIELTPLK